MTAEHAKTLPDTKRPTGRTITIAEREAFLSALGQIGTISGAARAAGVGRRTIYDLIARDPEFSLAVKDAQQIFDDRLCEELHRQGTEGFEQAVFQRGERARDVGGRPATIRIPQPRLLELIARIRIASLNESRLRVEHSVRPGDSLFLTQADLNLLPATRRRELVQILSEIACARDNTKALPAPEAIDAEFEDVTPLESIPRNADGSLDI